ncbi:MAG TPA: dihydropteroate synthase [Solirubrobacteraceae bacterium]|nr:dihydropteroate synthase [Solirubrobacteraceae bacterium]
MTEDAAPRRVDGSLAGFRLMGIVNATPDSFSDGGRFLQPDAAIAHGLRLIDDGAAIVDVGGESTRPGAEPVPAAEELERVRPVLEGLASAATGAQISIDTSKALVAHAALAAGATLVNDVSALRADQEMAGVVAEAGADCCLVHMLGSSRTMQRTPRYDDVVDDVKAFLHERLQYAVGAGIDERRVLLDPGVGFGKTVEHNLQLLARLDELVELGCPLVIGTSRKSFIGRLAGTPAGSDRLAGTLATNVLALERGASVFRVHDVAPAREALLVAAATLGERWTASSRVTTPTS